MGLEDYKNNQEQLKTVETHAPGQEESFEDAEKSLEAEMAKDLNELKSKNENIKNIENAVNLSNPEDVDAAKKELGVEEALKDIDQQAGRLKQETEKEIEWLKLENHVFNEESFYRIVNEKGFNDYVENKILRSSPMGTEPEMVGRFDIGSRPTAFPSFNKGAPDLSYAKQGEDNYIFESQVPMYKRGDKHPITGGTIKGRHWAYRPIDPETGKTILEMTPEMISNIYKIDKEGGLFLKK